MRFFFAGSEAEQMDTLLQENGVKNALMSFYALKNKGDQKIRDKLNMFPYIFMDSGGFTARVSGKPISVKDYADFLLKFKDQIFCYANLDLKTTEETLHNQNYLESKGLKPLPVFHRDEWEDKKKDLLISYLENYDYIALGGVAGMGAQKNYVKGYLDYCFHFINKYPGKKVHGFGMNALWIVKRYPFYSVDSTNWLNGGKFGSVLDDTIRISDTSLRKHSSNHEYSKMMDWKQLNKKNILALLKLEKEITYLWKTRGVEWKD